MFDRIIVTLDGSRFAEAALGPACEMASLFHSQILVTRAIKPLGEAATLFGGGRDVDLQLERIDAADTYLREVVERLSAEGYSADFSLFIAEPGTSITRIAGLRHADLIVMNTRLRWKVDPSSQNPASVTLRVLQRTRTPILNYHLAEMKPSDGAVEDTQRARTAMPLFMRPDAPIVVPLDGSPFAEQAIVVAEELARACGSYLVLVCAIPPTEATRNDVEHFAAVHTHVIQEREARDNLARLRAQVESQGVAVTTCVEVGTPIGVIEHVWREQGAGLIVLASHGSSGHHGTLIGSVAAAILEELEAPTLVIQPTDALADALDGQVQTAQPARNNTLDA